EQAIRVVVLEIHARDEQRPIAGRKPHKVSTAEWPLRERVALADARHQPRFDVVATRQGEKTIASRERCELVENADGAANEQRAALPVAGEECRRTAAAEQCEGRARPRERRFGHAHAASISI